MDAQGVADEIALALERMGNLKFKVIAYRKLQEIMRAGALGCELRLSGKLPSERAKSWRFAEGYLKKAGDSAKEVDRAQATGLTKTGIIGVKVAIMPPEAKIYDRIIVDDEMRSKLGVVENVEEDEKPKKKRKSSVKSKKKTQNKSVKKEIDVKAEKVALAAGEVTKAEEENDKAKNGEKVKTPTIEDSKEILHNKLEEIEEEHDNIVDHGDNVNKSEETQDSKN